MTEQPNKSATTFVDLGITPRLLSVLETCGFSVPTPIQHKSIPVGIRGEDIIGIAQTGTGKTLAYSIPMIERVLEHDTYGLVVVPTRELALQAEETISRIGAPLGIRTSVLIGGAPMRVQVGSLRRGPHIVIATPGRLIDHLEQGTISLDGVGVLVLDEADRMLDMGFAPQIQSILRHVPPAEKRQTMLFSATMPDGVIGIAKRHMALPVRVEVAPQGTAAERVEQEIIIVNRDAKMDLLNKILLETAGTVLVFSRTKHGASRIASILKRSGESAIDIHSDRSLSQRLKALDGFKRGTYRVLVATDIAARGIDVTDIGLVINFDLPDNPEDYVHRIGRTGRAGKEGKAVSFATPSERSDIKAIEKLIRKPLSLTRHESVPEIVFAMEHMPKERSSRSFGQRGYSGGRAHASRQRQGSRRNNTRPSSTSPRTPRFYH